MASSGNRGSAGERVLESRHVIGLFMAVVVLSGLFFSLGYFMGRNQAAGSVAANLRDKPPVPSAANPVVISKKNNKTAPADAPGETSRPQNSEWEFYHAGDRKKPEDHLKPAAATQTPTPAVAKNTEPVVVKTKAVPSKTSAASSKNAGAKQSSGGPYVLQVAALNKDADALDLAKKLQQRKFPAFVLPAKTDKYYRVQVGPYSDPQAAEAARQGLEGAGFKAFVKHN